jgi:subtilase family serine protease
MDAVQYAIDQNLAPVLSVSYGLCELQTLKSDMLLMQTWAQQANAQGMTWVNAAGDSGGADCYSGSSGGSSSGAGLAVDSPADIPEVTGIGGTAFNEASGQYWNASNSANGGSATAYIPETVWNDSTAGNPAAGGGGASTVFTQPSWQTGLGVPSNGARNVPDISLNASADHDGYMVYSSGQLSVYGGTSAGTPVFAGIAALLNHYLVASGAQTAAGAGNVNPRLYALAQAGTGAFHDVTAGNNDVTVTCGPRARNCTPGTYGYPAGQGYDLASGLGSIDAYNLVTTWHSGAATGSRAAATVALQATTTSVISTGSVTVTATVTGSGGRTPTGSVTFSSGGKQIGVGTLSGSGSSATASITVSAAQLQVGSNSIVAQYSGDSALNSATATISVAVTAAAGSAPTISGAANGASFQKSYAPGMVVSIFGTNLAGATWVASTVPLAVQASGVSVKIGGVDAPLYYVSAGQINAQIPYETPVNQTVTLSVNNSVATASTTFSLSAAGSIVITQ